MKINQIIFLCSWFRFPCFDELYLDNQIQSFGFFVWKRYQTKTVLTARTGRMAHNGMLFWVRMCEPCCITTKAAIAL